MRTIFAALVCCLLFAAHASAQLPLAPATGKTIDVGLGYSYVRQGQNVSSPAGLMGGDANITIGYSRFELRVDLGYARSAPLGGTGRHTAVLSYLAGPVFHPMIHRNFDTYVQVLAGAARVSGPVPLGGGSYLLGGWASSLAWEVGAGVEYRVTDAIVIRTGVDYMRTSYFDPSLTLRGQSNIRSTASIVYSFVRRSRTRRLG
jgi:opacity protein-like surface antigen